MIRAIHDTLVSQEKRTRAVRRASRVSRERKRALVQRFDVLLEQIHWSRRTPDAEFLTPSSLTGTPTRRRIRPETS